MLKAKKIIRDLKNLKGNKYFGVYEAQNKFESKNLYISELDIVRGLADYEIDFEKIYKADFEDVVYGDAVGNYMQIDLDYKDACDNSYNWCSQVTFDYRQIQVIDKHGDEHEYIAIKFHRYGDVRGNYTDDMILDMDMDSFYETIMEVTSVYASVKYKGNEYCISTNAFKESCLFDIYSEDAVIDDYDVLLDIDNLRSKADIKKGLISYLKEQEQKELCEV